MAQHSTIIQYYSYTAMFVETPYLNIKRPQCTCIS